ncbi:MerR family transcriptional regulator [Sorangium sp. So ce1504]|uniref:MerR family transcriptional regulator n=1 Tax=Sorangium sp. So ce1504 TaxID=3133337 RepID=UPI003F5D9508
MFLKIGELARRTGLTVRALRHYDEIGLLVPSGRSMGGYRLYDRKDVARLYRIQALQRLDLSLADIQDLLDNAAGGLSEVVARQVAQLDREILQASALRTHLLAVQGQLQANEEPGIDDWLVALESMVAGSKYFSEDEQRTLKAQRDGLTNAVAGQGRRRRRAGREAASRIPPRPGPARRLGHRRDAGRLCRASHRAARRHIGFLAARRHIGFLNELNPEGLT